MFRQASLILGAIVLIAALNYRPPAGNAWDDVKPAREKDPATQEPEKYENFDIGDPEPDPYCRLHRWGHPCCSLPA